jgi:type IV pilus assembly protein PilE
MPNRSFAIASRRVHGFTLVELMIAVVIVAIIAAIALPAYNLQTQKARRAEARNALLDIAGREERFLSVSNAYSATPADVGYAGAGWPQNSSNGYYQINVTVPNPAFPAGTPSFLITATAIGTQLNDTACASFTVDQTGAQTALNSAAALNSTTCWGI